MLLCVNLSPGLPVSKLIGEEQLEFLQLGWLQHLGGIFMGQNFYYKEQSQTPIWKVTLIFGRLIITYHYPERNLKTPPSSLLSFS